MAIISFATDGAHTSSAEESANLLLHGLLPDVDAATFSPQQAVIDWDYRTLVALADVPLPPPEWKWTVF